eukprot:scaffold43684_cov52-Attheya_sp.AAC.2
MHACMSCACSLSGSRRNPFWRQTWRQTREPKPVPALAFRWTGTVAYRRASAVPVGLPGRGTCTGTSRYNILTLVPYSRATVLLQ